LNHGTRATIGGILLVIFLLIFIMLVLQVAVDPKGIGLEEQTDFLREELLGNLILISPGVISIIFALLLVWVWSSYNKEKDLRYKMAFYLYHSKVNKDDIIPLDHLARVAVCTVVEIATTLERMINKGELKGIVNRKKGLYIHKGLTKRTMRILQALPPAKTEMLSNVKRWALKGASAYEEEIDELEPINIEELPSATEEIRIKSKEKTIPCPSCRKMNRPSDHFCTYCGEVVDDVIPPESY
jgi:hypothetical protein